MKAATLRLVPWSFILLLGIGTPATWAAPASAKTLVSGQVTVTTALAKTVRPTDVLYIVLRNPGVQMPVAVLRIPGPKFPQSFEMTPAHFMMPGLAHKGPYNVLPKLSRRGDAITHRGDLLGKPVGPVKEGATKVKLALTEPAR